MGGTIRPFRLARDEAAMLTLLAFIAGGIMLIKGNFRLLNRTVSKRDGRLAGLTSTWRIEWSPFGMGRATKPERWLS